MRNQKREKNNNWKGGQVALQTGRSRAERWYPTRPCDLCGKEKAERHHIDGNPLNNAPENIMFLCRKHHMRLDGRLQKLPRSIETLRKIRSKINPDVLSKVVKASYEQNPSLRALRKETFRIYYDIKFAMRFWFVIDECPPNCHIENKNIHYRYHRHHAEEIRCNRYRNKPSEPALFKQVEIAV